MPYYEVLCLASGKLQRAELTDLLRKTCRAFMHNGATVTRVAPLGATGHGPRKLAYWIRRNQVTYKTGFYVNICAFASPAALAEVNRQLQIDERVIRHLSVKRSFRDAVEPLPSIDDLPPAGGGLDPNDPEYALRKFMADYERRFPTDERVTQTESNFRKGAEGDDVRRGQNTGPSDSAMSNVLASLKASSQAAKEKPDRGLGWLSDLRTGSVDSPPSSKSN